MSESLRAFKAGSRGSQLALAQTQEAIGLFQQLVPTMKFESVVLTTPGDRDKTTDLRLSPPDFFTRDLHEAVLNGIIDCAVHSAKDLSETMPDGVDWFWLPSQFDSRDALVLRRGEEIEGLKAGVLVGGSSDRRTAYCRQRFPHFRSASIRGTIEERLAQLDAGNFDMLIMAAAALQRLGLEDRINRLIPINELLPPEGQGRLAVTFKVGDTRFKQLRSLFVKPVVFVGAGPASRELCTLAGSAALEACEVCLYDALVDASLLELVPANTAQIAVGKRCGCHPVDQNEICRLLALYARRGSKVVRLKGGDPGLFSRLGEEIDFLESIGLPYRVIPGVSSLNAATTGTGLLLTRRGISRAFTVLTPRDTEGKFVSLSLTDRRNMPLVFFMTRDLIREVTTDLLNQGYRTDLPAAVVSNAGLESQTVTTDTLGRISERYTRAAGSQPALLIVGETASPGFLYHQDLSALKGRRVLVTCSAELQHRLAKLVTEYGGIPLRYPMINLLPEESAKEVLTNVHQYDWVVLTSPSAAMFFARLIEDAGVDWRALPKFIVAGPGTDNVLRKHHIRADVQPDRSFGNDGLLTAVQQHVHNGASVLHCRSDQTDGSISATLQKIGAQVTDCVLYRNIPIRYPQQPDFDAAVFASKSAVRAFVANWGTAALTETMSAAIGQPTATALKNYGCKSLLVAPEATADSVVRKLAARCVEQDIET